MTARRSSSLIADQRPISSKVRRHPRQWVPSGATVQTPVQGE